ncbi:sigma 54-interacting transcriptional regulator [Candidatus Litorirhabdus singularis]|uniref:sigma 54-interacting transcriptional regulator n=1 Tax=Candidatus Litorirhabdus singularis TaxID=2518993 RepID=UPI00242FC50F|nr:sigma 54-interacting transcriptional regulator [Candidatus Litorirhabdus singularis]
MADRGPETTIPEVALRHALAVSAPRLVLTILYHPNLKRVGQRGELGKFKLGQVAELSRHSPLFTDPHVSANEAPLADRHISRQPIVFTRDRAGVAVSLPARGSSLHVDGQAVIGSHHLSRADLSRGVVLLLARRLVLLLKLAPVETGAEASRDSSFIGASSALDILRSEIGAVAATDAAVMLRGESGTGKELAAQAIHSSSARREQPLVAVNMAAIPAELAAAELFGVRKGAFTGADADKPGYFQQAAGGTLFLDEIGACPEPVQPLLLRALESGEVQRAGGRIETVDVRVVSATDASVEEQGFSAALLHRLAVVTLRVPPLRDRVEDVGLLFFHFLRELDCNAPAPLHQPQMDPVIHGQWAALVVDLARYRWPGNVRELRNFCQQIVLSTRAHGSLRVPQIIMDALHQDSVVAFAQRSEAYRVAAELPADEVIRVMEQADYEPARAARLLDVSRTALYKRLQGIEELRLANDVPAQEVREVYRQSEGQVQQAAATHRVSRPALLRRWRALELAPRAR